MSESEKEAAQERFQSNTRSLGEIWARLVGDANVSATADAVYVHGLSKGMVESCDLLGLATRLVDQGRVTYLSYNGSDGRGASPDSKPGEAWPGSDWFRKEFLKRRVSLNLQCPTGPGLHTRSETDEFVMLAKKYGWTTAYVVTVPYHWPRSLSCLVGSMNKYDHQMKIWFAAPDKTPDWNFPMEGSQGVISDSTYGREAGDDVHRLFNYWDKGREDDGQAWRERYGAPPEEVHRYLNWRDGLDNT